MSEERLQKYISSCGVTSRRKAEDLITSGCVSVNGKTVRTVGIKVDPDRDTVEINGQIITKKDGRIYIKLNKPIGYVTTVKDQFGRKCVADLVDAGRRVYPVGRLDFDTSGLLLLTDDGELANKLMHPKYNVYKTYVAMVKGDIDVSKLIRLRNGVMIDGRVTSEAKIKMLGKTDSGLSNIEISIHEGRNRQVRKMFEAVGCTVVKLKRIAYGKIVLGDLKTGQWCYLSNDEVRYLKSDVTLSNL